MSNPKARRNPGQRTVASRTCPQCSQDRTFSLLLDGKGQHLPKPGIAKPTG